MDEVETLRQCIHRYPHKKFLVKLLADELQQQFEMIRFSALRQGSRIRRTEINTKEIASAEKLLDDKSPVRGNLYLVLIAVCDNPGIRLCNVFVVAGSRPPAVECRYCGGPGAWWYESDITVGARWVIREAFDIQVDVNHLTGAISSHHAGS